MPRIVRTCGIAAPGTTLSCDRREYLSATGATTLVLHDPIEWHMGADGWRASLLSSGRDLSHEHPVLRRFGEGRGLRAPSDLQPWAPDGRTLALLTWEETDPVCLYDTEGRRVTRLTTGSAFPYSAQWAPDSDRLLIRFASGGTLFDAAGQRQGTLEWSVARDESFYTYWMRSGIVFLVARASRGSKTKITFYSSVSGGPIGAEDLDPTDLLPYDAAAYAGLSRDEYSLTLGSGTWGAGVLLDTWHDVRFVLETNTLLLATCRPTSAPSSMSAPHRRGRQLMCQAEERWVQVDLAP